MQPTVPKPNPTTEQPDLLGVLSSLNEIGSAISRIGPESRANIDDTLHLIAESVIRMIPGASAAIHVYDQAKRTFDPGSRVSAGKLSAALLGHEPRPDGMGHRAISGRRRILSYQEPDLDIHPLLVGAGAKAAVCFPLVVADQDLGAFHVYLGPDRPFSQLELLILEHLGNQAGIAIYQTHRSVRFRLDLARKEDELNRLRRAGMLISSRLRLEETLEAILQMALEVTNAHYGILRLVDKEGRNLVTSAIAGDHLGRPKVEALPIDRHSVMGWVAEHRETVLIPDLHLEPWVDIYYPLDTDLEMRSELTVPLIGASGRLEGVLNLESPRVGAFGEDDSHLLQALATQAVIAIQEVRLLDALQEVAQLLLTQPCQDVLNRLAELARDLLNAAASAIWTLQENRLVLQSASAGYQRGESLPLDGSLTGQAILQGGPVTSEDVRSDPRFHRPDLARLQNWRHALVVPVLSHDLREPMGAFSVYGTDAAPRRLATSEWDEKVLTCLAHYAALTVHNAARQDALRAAQQQYAVAETFAAVGDIAANVLHHLNNKVGTIPVRVQGIQDKCRSALLADPYLATNLAEIERSACEAMEAVRENLAHLNPIRLLPVDVASCVFAAIQSAQLPDTVDVQTTGLDRLPPVMAGQQSLAFVFTNLLENAADAMRGHGRVAIRGETSGNSVQIQVSDDGPGIEPLLHDRIFEFSFSGQRSGRSSKLGFGLWWVKTLMVRLSGTVSVESDGVHGTTFHLELPRAEEGA